MTNDSFEKQENDSIQFYFSNKQYSKAITLSKSMLDENDVNNIYYYNTIADSYYKLSDYNNCLQYYFKLININKKEPSVLLKNYFDIAKVYKN